LRPYLPDKYFFPIGLGYIATAVKRAGFDLEILDLDLLRNISSEETEALIANISCDAVLTGCLVNGYSKMKDLFYMIRRYHDVPIIVGNSVGSSIPEIILNKTEADIVVFEEGDVTIVDLLRAIEDRRDLEVKDILSDVKGIAWRDRETGEVVYNEEREMIEDLDSIPYIDYDLWDMERYIEMFKHTLPEPYPIPFDEIRAFPFITSRGCLFKCSFCYHMFLGKRFRYRSIENLMKEVETVKNKYNINVAYFADDLTLFSKKQAKELADYFIDHDLNMHWSCCCRAGLLDENDKELAEKLKKSGCFSLMFALESADEEILKAMNKKISLKEYKEQARLLHDVGIIVPTSIVLGYPQETPETIKKTFDFCRECEMYPSVGYLLPQPKTVMYELAKERGLIEDDEEYLLNMGDRQDFKINFTKMDREEMEALVKNHIKDLAKYLEIDVDEDHLIKMGHIKEKKLD
jgi:radical SAM superfamily enzyme YgiQ (UPF0313 family)